MRSRRFPAVRRIVLLSAIPLLVTLALLLAGCRTEYAEDDLAHSYQLGHGFRYGISTTGWCAYLGPSSDRCATLSQGRPSLDALCHAVESNGAEVLDPMLRTLKDAGWWRYASICERWRAITPLLDSGDERALDDIQRLYREVSIMVGADLLYDPRRPPD